MEIRYHARFLKHYRKRVAPMRSLRTKTKKRISLFKKDPRSQLLDDHPLKGAKAGLRSFSITGDYRIVYQWTGEVVEFVDVGTHNQVY